MNKKRIYNILLWFLFFAGIAIIALMLLALLAPVSFLKRVMDLF